MTQEQEITAAVALGTIEVERRRRLASKIIDVDDSLGYEDGEFWYGKESEGDIQSDRMAMRNEFWRKLTGFRPHHEEFLGRQWVSEKRGDEIVWKILP